VLSLAERVGPPRPVIPATRYMHSFSVAQTQLVEIAKALSHGAEVIFMDEPTSAIGDRPE
jgi:putative xylitol transport system ATP-binding protein